LDHDDMTWDSSTRESFEKQERRGKDETQSFKEE
jgi:hypothetical protein